MRRAIIAGREDAIARDAISIALGLKPLVNVGRISVIADDSGYRLQNVENESTELQGLLDESQLTSE
jgi:hypothetical protein